MTEYALGDMSFSEDFLYEMNLQNSFIPVTIRDIEHFLNERRKLPKISEANKEEGEKIIALHKEIMGKFGFRLVDKENKLEGINLLDKYVKILDSQVVVTSSKKVFFGEIFYLMRDIYSSHENAMFFFKRKDKEAKDAILRGISYCWELANILGINLDFLVKLLDEGVYRHD